MKVPKTVALAASSVLALGSIAPAFAHEVRILPANNGNIRLVVGFHVEPAFEDSFNAVDVILSTFDGTCPAPNTDNLAAGPVVIGYHILSVDGHVVDSQLTFTIKKPA